LREKPRKAGYLHVEAVEKPIFLAKTTTKMARIDSRHFLFAVRIAAVPSRQRRLFAHLIGARLDLSLFRPPSLLSIP
jgi:hypothetical protein